MSDKEADQRRGLNRKPLSPDPLLAQIELAPIKNMLARSRAARMLLEYLNKPLADRQPWFDVSSGYPLLNDAVGSDGMKLLVILQRLEVDSLPTGGRSGNPAYKVDDVEYERLIARSAEIGFMQVPSYVAKDVPEEPLKPGPEMDAEASERDAYPVVKPPSTVYAQEPSSEELLFDAEEYVKKMSALITKKSSRSPIAAEIIEALRNCSNPRTPAAVWSVLLEMAKSKRFPTLKYINDTEIKIPHGASGDTSYRKGALGQYLRRYQQAIGYKR